MISAILAAIAGHEMSAPIGRVKVYLPDGRTLYLQDAATKALRIAESERAVIAAAESWSGGTGEMADVWIAVDALRAARSKP